MYLSEDLENKWGKLLDFEDLDPIANPWTRAVTGVVLENQQQFTSGRQYLKEAAPTNATGSYIDNYDPVLISLVRRSVPNLIPFDICGVQPMTGPVGLIFALYSTYSTQGGTEALFNEANTYFSSANAGGNANATAHSGTDPVANISNSSYVFTSGQGMTTATAEALGDSSNNAFNEMSFRIDKISVTANERALKAEYTHELAHDLRAIHNLSLDTELSNILANEITAEINREVVRQIYRSATAGAQTNTTTAGVFDLDTDSNGRWSEERFKGLYFQLQRDANQIAKATRRGKGNLAIVSSDVASALAMAGVLSYAPKLNNDLQVDDTGYTFAGRLSNGMKVFIDPYFQSDVGNELVCVGYKGSSPFDAGLFYCPYVPLTLYRAVGNEGTNEFQPKLGMKTRYGMVANPMATTNHDGVVGDRNTAGNANIYYRIFAVQNLM